MLGLQYLAPSGFLCFVFLEGAVALGILLALAELVSWWGVLVLPLTVAGMVKLNDVVAGALTRPSSVAPPSLEVPGTAGWPAGAGSAGRPGAASSAARPEAAEFGASGGAQAGGFGDGRFAASEFAAGGRTAGTFAAGGRTASTFAAGGPAMGGSTAAGPAMTGGPATGHGPALGPLSGRNGPGSPGAETVRLPPSMFGQPGGSPSLRPAADPHRRPPTADDIRSPENPFPEPFPHDAASQFLGEVNLPQATAHRPGTPDDQQQRARQSAARRYE